MSEVRARLGEVQKALKVPKAHHNDFGKYHYRNAEDILNAVKPFLQDSECVIISEEIVVIGDRVYVKSTASFYCGMGQLSATSFAREPVSKKGMDESQVTGSAASYARKYALGGLFAIDEGRDADSAAPPPQNAPAPRRQAPPRDNGPTQQQRKEMAALTKQLGWTGQDLKAFGETTVGAKGSMTQAQADEMLHKMRQIAENQGGPQ